MISDGGASCTSYSEAGAEPAVLPLDGSDAESKAEGAAEDEAWKHIADEAAVEEVPARSVTRSTRSSSHDSELRLTTVRGPTSRSCLAPVGVCEL